MTKHILIKHNNEYKYHDTSTWLSVGVTPSEANYTTSGMTPAQIEAITEAQWSELTGERIISVFESDILVEEITIETETEPYSIYDEFGDSMEVLYYTDDPDKTEAELEIAANYSPLDEIEGDFEVVTWTDESTAITGDRTLNMNATPKPHLIKQINPLNMQSEISNFVINNANNPSKMFLLSNDQNTWKKWNGSAFEIVDIADESTIPDVAMTATELSSITKEQWQTWDGVNLYLGIYLSGSDVITNISYDEIAPKESTQILDARLYILNTVSTINVQLNGARIKGILDDEDRGKVQYRVILNGQNYYPKDGSFTECEPAPVDIDIRMKSDDYLIDENNILRVEFKDYWGTVDFWETNFIGKAEGIFFTDKDGDFYSNELGQILKRIDFGILIAGTVTTEQEIRIKNMYPYAINNIKVFVKEKCIPNGMKIELGTNIAEYEAVDELHFDKQLASQEELIFYLRLNTTMSSPTSSGDFNIIVVADQVTV